MNALKMQFEEFTAWAAGYVLMGIGRGTSIQCLMNTVVDHAMRNEVFNSSSVMGRLEKVIGGCPHCEYDEAEGGLYDHCEGCRCAVTAEVYKIVNGE